MKESYLLKEGVYITGITTQKFPCHPNENLERIEVIQEEKRIIRNYYKGNTLISKIEATSVNDLIKLDKIFNWRINNEK